jgi:hypothetical protein
VPCPKKESNPKNIESVAEQQWQLSKHWRSGMGTGI